MKHVGQVKSTGRRCIVVFRHIYDDNGKIIDKNNCLVVETDNLPDMEHQDMMRIVESEPAQTAGEMYNILVRERFSNGSNALEHLTRTGRLRKYPTDKVILTPDSNMQIPLSEMNFMIEKIDEGWTEDQINKHLQNTRDDTDTAGRQLHHVTSEQMNESAGQLNEGMTQPSGEPMQPSTAPGVLSDEDIAREKLKSAKYFSDQAEKLKKEAYDLAPSMKPGRKSSKKSAEKTDS